MIEGFLFWNKLFFVELFKKLEPFCEYKLLFLHQIQAIRKYKQLITRIWAQDLQFLRVILQ